MNRKSEGSMTVEASFVLPIFLFAMILVGYIGQMIRCQDKVQSALCRVAREASAEYGMSKNKAVKSQAYYLGKMSLYLDGAAGKVTFFESRLLKEKDEIDLVASYRLKMPFSIFSLNDFKFRQRVHTRAFTGVEQRETIKDEDSIVYLAETGRVYHRSRECTYLKPAISKVLYDDLENLRNNSGGKYKICERCCRG